MKTYGDPRILAQELYQADKSQLPSGKERKSIIDEDLRTRAYGNSLLKKAKSWDFNGANNDLFFDKTPEGTIAFDKFNKYANGKPITNSQDVVLRVAQELANQNRFNLNDKELAFEENLRRYPNHKMTQEQLDGLFGDFVELNPLPFQKNNMGHYLDGRQIRDYYNNFLKSIYFDGDEYDFDDLMKKNTRKNNVGLLYALDKVLGWR